MHKIMTRISFRFKLELTINFLLPTYEIKETDKTTWRTHRVTEGPSRANGAVGLYLGNLSAV